MRPLKTEIIVGGDMVKQGSSVSIMCRVTGARPAAVINWYNGTTQFAEQPGGQIALQVRRTTFFW